MSVAALVLGIISFIGGFVVWFPCLGWSSWFAWVLPVIGLALGIPGTISDSKQQKGVGMGVAAIVLCAIAFMSMAIRGIISIFTLGI